MAISRVSANHGKSIAGPPTFTMPSSVAVGNIVAVYLKNLASVGPKIQDPTNGSGKDSLGNTYSKLVEVQNTDGAWISLWMSIISSAGSCLLTAHLNGGASWDGQVIAAQEYQGWIGTPTLDQTHTGFGTSTGVDASDSGLTGTTLVADELLLGGHGDAFNGNVTAGTNYSIIESGDGSNGRFGFEDRIVSVINTYKATFNMNASNPWGCVIATVYDTASLNLPMQGISSSSPFSIQQRMS